MKDNKTTELEGLLFDDLTQITRIDLDNNLLTHLDPQLFANLPKLTILGLGWNELENIPHLIAPHLEEIYLLGNPIPDDNVYRIQRIEANGFRGSNP